ncbi:hypothetical protein [Desulforhopalus singaporensis]|uniref:hypothetical protein n=1 Tax=Desulforhopalus singaporensis TaxID=91360 RepID=UPI00115F83E3|nr:hypothetical protein [Desulforhopalus singaporensis]
MKKSWENLNYRKETINLKKSTNQPGYAPSPQEKTIPRPGKKGRTPSTKYPGTWKIFLQTIRIRNNAPT